MALTTLPWDFVLILFVLGVIVPWRGANRVSQLLARSRLETLEKITIYASTIAFQWTAAGVTAWRSYARGWNPAQLGLQLSQPKTIIPGISLALGLAAFQFASFRHLRRIPPARRGRLYEISQRIMPQTLTEMFPFIALVCTVSICEEFLYRGFVFAVFYMSFGNSLVAATIGSSAFFGIGHIYQGTRGMTTAFSTGMLLAVVRAWSGSLVPVMIMHFAVDLMAAICGWGFLTEGRSGTAQGFANSGTQRQI
jgi:membrane protease YdiL (CAAX protease family)